MNKVIIMSEQPKWLVKILNGEKTVVIRKLMPKCELPIDVYLACSKGHQALYNKYFANGELNIYKAYFLDDYGYHKPPVLNGKVVAKFTLNKVGKVSLELVDFSGYDEDKEMEYVSEHLTSNELTSESCLDEYDIDNYLLSRSGYAWHIDDLVVFDKPMSLGDFYKQKPNKITDAVEKMFNDLTKYRVIKTPHNWRYAYIKGE